MSGTSNTVPRAGGLSLYANLLDPDAKNSSEFISKGSVAFKPLQTSSEHKKPLIDPAALRFQPTKRPQLTQKSKPKPSIPKSTSIEGQGPGSSLLQATSSTHLSNQAKIVKTSLADWTTDRDEDVFYGTEKRQRGGRKKKKRNKEDIVIQDWDDIYDPNRPNNFEEYKNSDEKIREIREWKDHLYAHREAKRLSNRDDSDEEKSRSHSGHLFAPPSNYYFAPPPTDNSSPKSPDKTSQNSPPPSDLPISSSNLPEQSDTPSVLSSVVSRAPVLYSNRAGPSDDANVEEDIDTKMKDDTKDDYSLTEENAPRSRRPGQKKFAERLMSKYGWSKGKGLGAEESGIINPLQVKLEKRKKKSDAEGGGFRHAGNRGKIIGGKQNAPVSKDPETNKFGPISEIISLDSMVNGVDLDEEVERGGNGDLVQEIGDECSEKYGNVERVYIHRTGSSARVFVKFTSQLSALRAVNALEGRIFNGHTIKAQFFDSERFEGGIYE
ncbi:putative g-patch dna repair protein [Golovinomyces cichoracearum]|uniref:Putative g-patch dna repair protein n=1 Tax=Golovinomyces cichoracearum TaxID=62708 RepID=A0A420J7U6_9PEZI|nr:putative g-patch dna repair protein [Golovinomyces cichoracearum]